MFRGLIIHIRKMLKIFRNLNIKYQLVFSYIPIFLVSLLVFGFISYMIVSSTLERNSKAFVSETLKVLSNDIDKKLTEYEKISTSLVLDYDVYYTLSEEKSDLDYYSRYEIIKQKLDYTTKNLADIRSIFIYAANKPIVIKSNSNIYFNDRDYKDSELFKKVTQDNKAKFWTLNAMGSFDNSSSKYIFLHRSIPATGGSNGLIQMQIYEDSIYNVYRNITFYKGSNIFVSDSKGTIVSHTDKNKIGSMFDSSMMSLMTGKKGSFTAKIGQIDYLVVYSVLDTAPWRLIATIPMDFVNIENKRVLSVSLIMILLTFVFTVTVSAAVASGIVKPLEKVGKSMESIEKGDFDVRLDFDSNNEIGNISRRYNTMVNEIKNLMEIIRREEKEKKEAYIQALQAQIKPHFLYNTLFTIKCLASIKKQPEIEELLDSLVNLLMGSINKGGEMVKISSEIEYVKSYILIQTYRYGDKFKVIYNIDPEIEDCIILKLLLQPIVENALLHGIEENCMDFTINITGSIENGDLVLKIRDNGKGIDMDKVHTILDAGKDDYKNVFSGIGIRNVNERIKLNFGDSYGLSYNSVVEEGTEAVIRLPVKRGEGALDSYA